MNEQLWIVVAIGLVIIFAVIAYNMYQENRYRQQVRSQFGHADKDALLEKSTESVRDGKTHGKQGEPVKMFRQQDLSETEPASAKPAARDLFEESEHKTTEKPAAAVQTAPVEKPKAEAKPKAEPQAEPVLTANNAAAETFEFKKIEKAKPSQTQPQHRKKLLLDLEDMARQQLSWFDPRFDYMAYVSLREPQELHAMPRLSGRCRYQIAGCTMDNLWQIAEPIPSVYYQGFIIGLQAISRSGLAATEDLEAFSEQVNQFAQKLDAGLKLADIESFLRVARPLDDVCARVDQAITMHLVSRGSISGTEMRVALEHAGFELGHDGAFHLSDEQGNLLFSAVSLDGSAFTPGVLVAKPFRGFSMLFDIPHIPAGEKNFNRFMDLVVGLSSELGLDLVNDKVEELSTEWLKNVRSYVCARQEEMQKIGIEPGSALAARVFA